MKKIKLLFSVCLVAVFVCCVGVSVSVRAEETEIDTNMFEYVNNLDGTVTITGYTGTDETVTIPSEINGMKVQSFGSFSSCKSLKHIIIDDNITEISVGAFSECKNLETVSLPDGLVSIGRRAFDDCSSLKTIHLPDGMKRIENYAFRGCSSLDNIDIPGTVTMIGEGAFRFCISLKKVTIPDSVTYIGEDAFNIRNDKTIIIYGNPSDLLKAYCSTDPKITFSCINHSNITSDNATAPTCTQNGKTEGSHCSDCGTAIKPQNAIPATGHSWDGGVITQEATAAQTGLKIFTCKVCTETKTDIIPKNPTPNKGKIISNSSDSYKVTKSGSKNSTVEFTASGTSKSSITIPNAVTIDGIKYKVTSIAKNAFKNNKKLKKITIGGNITNINSNAFSGCKNLKTITIQSKNIKSVGKNAFKGIKANAKIKVPSGKLSKYKKLFAEKGQRGTVKITK